jgi:predicted heme/steroid binding protein
MQQSHRVTGRGGCTPPPLISTGMRRRREVATDVARAAAPADGGGAGKTGAAPPRRRAGWAVHCCGRLLLATLLALALAGIGLLAVNDFSVSRAASSVNFVLMRFFRDLSRAKARRRRFGQKDALMSVLMRSEQPLPLGDASAGLSLTAEELTEFDGRQLPESEERAPLLLAIRGRIYDVSAGASFYGPGRSYHKLVARDATRAFCTGCLEPACLIPYTDGLSEAQLKESDRWIELYEHHDKYKLVGQLREAAPSLEAAEAGAAAAEEERASGGGSGDAAEAEARAASEYAEARLAYQRELVEKAQQAEGSRKFRPFRLR